MNGELLKNMLLSDNVTEKRKSQFKICEKEEIIHVVNKLRFLMIDCRKDSRISIDLSLIHI